jgi:diguanylate cyclase (GGDEF)-like protein
MKVLVVDDEAVSRRLIESSLRRWGYDVVVAADGLEAKEILFQKGAPRLAVLDWLMPGLDGVQLCRELRMKMKEDDYVYVLLLTAKQSKADVVEGLEAGADDYIAKPFEPRELRVRVRTGKRIIYLLEQLTAARESLRDLASRDSLTGLWNHAAIVDLLSGELSRANRQERPLGVVLFDLDHFKEINDVYGHQAGDQVLRAVAGTISAAIRPYDAVGRVGGEEFLLVLPGCDQLNAVSHAERLRLALGKLAIATSQGEIQFTASSGVTLYEPGSEIGVQSLIRTADTAMYEAKHLGRNRVCFRASLPEPAPANA